MKRWILSAWMVIALTTCVSAQQQQAVMDKTHNNVVRVGYCDFVPTMDTNTEYVVTNAVPQPIDLTFKYIAASNLYVEMTAAEQDAIMQDVKTIVMKITDNKFLYMCDTLTGATNHVKLGFVELGAIIEQMTNQTQVVMVTLQLLTIDAQAKREGGLLWWDSCEWHPEVVPYMMAPRKQAVAPKKK